MSKRRRLETSLIVFAQDCSPNPNTLVTPEECEAIAEVFKEAAIALRSGQHGAIRCWPKGEEIIAEVGIDRGGKFDMDNGLPVLKMIELKEPQQ